MNPRTLLPLATLAASLAAQGPVEPAKTPRPLPYQPDVKTIAPAIEKTSIDFVTGAVADGPAAANLSTPKTRAPELAVAALRRADVIVDRPLADGPIWASGGGYKVAFDGAGWTFIPYLGAEYASMPVRFALRSITTAGSALELGANAAPRGNAIEYQHAGCVERIDLRSDDVEQTFRFDHLATRGAIDIVLDVTTDLAGADAGDGVVFHTPRGDVRYSEAVAIDAAGRRVHAETTFADGRISIHVPAAFVAEATLPLVVDPIVGSPVSASVAGYQVQEADIAWSETSQCWAMAFERIWSATDRDVFVQRYDSAMTEIGGLVSIDNSGMFWQRPRIASKRIGDCFLTVAQVSASGSAPFWVGGRVMTGSGILSTAQFDIARDGVTGHASGDKLNPDVGGDPSTASPTYFCVVWERVFTATDHDVHMKLVTTTGTLLNAAPVLLENSGATLDTLPTVSKSNGAPPSNQQVWGVAWQRTQSPTDDDALGAFVNWDGNIRTVAGNPTFVISATYEAERTPTFSSPTQASVGRTLLAVYQQTIQGNAGDIVGALYDTSGVLVDREDLTTIEGDNQRLAWDQRNPSVDCDGLRFAVTYEEPWAYSAIDIDTRVALFANVPGVGLVAQESAVVVAGSSSIEDQARIASRYSGSGVRALGYAIVDRFSASASSIEVSRYDGYGRGGFATRQTGCGGLTFTASGRPVIGEAITLQHAVVNAWNGLLFGLPTALPIGVCPGCTLGVQGDTLMTSSLQVNVPLDPALVGAVVSFQGFNLIGGTCFGQLALSDTIDVTVQ